MVWGAYCQEDYGLDLIFLTILVVSLIASLLFAILWLQFQFNVQRAFAVSAWIMSILAARLVVLVLETEK